MKIWTFSSGANGYMVKILWHRRETKRQMEKTNINLRYLNKLVYSISLICEAATYIRRLPESRFSLKKIAKKIGEKKDVES
jgi:hypothetical protein